MPHTALRGARWAGVITNNTPFPTGVEDVSYLHVKGDGGRLPTCSIVACIQTYPLPPNHVAAMLQMF